MRHIFILGALVVAACTANVSINKTPISQRVSDACGDLDALCTSGTCLPKQAFCQESFTTLYLTEDSCKTSCQDVRSCIKGCKATRVNAITSALATMDLNGDGIAGDGATACTTLGSTCSSSGEGCTAGEFFCPAFAMASSPCMTELQTCKAGCAPHDRVCLKQCRDAYKQCLAGPSPDAGVPDAPLPPPPDAPTTTTYDLTYGTTAGSTGTGTVTVNPAGSSCGAMCATYAAGTMVTLTATASSGSSFTAWVGCTSTTNRCTVTMTQALTVTATFTLATTTTSYTYTTDIAPKMTGLCNGCHSGSSPPGNYFTDSYTGLFGNGSDTTPNIIPGDANSLFVQKIAGNHHNVLTLYPGFDTVARDWVVNNNAAK